MKKSAGKGVKLLTGMLLAALCFGTSVFAAEAEMSQDEIDAAIVQEERAKRKEELGGLTYSADEERYASLYGAHYDAGLDTRPDVAMSDKWLLKMKYITEPFTAPVFKDIDRRFFCTDVVTFSGHGTPSTVRIGTPWPDDNAEHSVGVLAATKNSTEGAVQYVGIGRRDLSDCRLMMFIACQTAENNGGIAKYAADHNAKAALGWTVDINSKVSPEWLDLFYGSLYKGRTIKQAVDEVNKVFVTKSEHATDPTAKVNYASLTHNKLYGAGQNQKLTYSPGRQDERDDIFTYIDEPLNIDCETGNLEELIAYLEKNVAGFDRETCELQEIERHEETGDYKITFERMYQGFHTFSTVTVFVEGDEIKYYGSMDGFKAPKAPVMFSSEVPESLIEQIKKEAREEVNTKDEVEKQIVIMVLNNDGTPWVVIKTVWRDDVGAFWSTTYGRAVEE